MHGSFKGEIDMSSVDSVASDSNRKGAGYENSRMINFGISRFASRNIKSFYLFGQGRVWDFIADSSELAAKWIENLKSAISRGSSRTETKCSIDIADEDDDDP